MGILSAVIALLLFSPSMTVVSPTIIYTIYFTVTLATGTLTGFQFTTASLSQKDSYAEISGKTYSYDLFGSALGALVITLYLVPKTGIIASVLAISFLNLLFGIILALRRK
jgi:predicted membrane-bound spermidine synthase